MSYLTKAEALKKYKETIRENDRLGLGGAFIAKIEEDTLVELAVSGLVKEIYDLEWKLAEVSDLKAEIGQLKERENIYKTTVNRLNIKNHAAIQALSLWNETGDVDRIQDESLEALKILQEGIGEKGI
jgi:phage tail tube protein FII